MRPDEPMAIEDHKSRWVVRVPEGLSERNICQAVVGIIADAARRSGVKSEAIIDLGERGMRPAEIERLKNEIEASCNIRVQHIFSNTADVIPRRQRQTLEVSAPVREHQKALFIRGSVRCGQVIDHTGPVVVAGNLNAGGFIRSGSSVTVLGDCAGEIVAGATGDTDSFIFACGFRPVRVKIGSFALGISDIPSDVVGGHAICGVTGDSISVSRHGGGAEVKGCIEIE